MAATANLIRLDALGPTGGYETHHPQTIFDVAGTAVAELSIVPRLYAARAMSSLRRAASLPVDERLAALARAGEAYRSATVDGVSAADYQRLVSRVSGLPIAVVRSAVEAIARGAAEAYCSEQNARPVGAVDNWRDPLTRTGRAVWTRRGGVLAVHAPGNSPAVHSMWLDALALGYRVAVRPSRREPFTPHRLVFALRAAGFGQDQVVMLPTDYGTADEIVRGADLAVVYGGDDVVRRYAAQSTILPQGPGRSKILVTADVDWRDHVDVIVDSISHGAGTGCVNTSAVFVEADATPVARAIAQRLAAIPSLPPEDEEARLPVLATDDARRIERHLLATAAGTTPWLGGDGIVDELGDGSAVLRPSVHELDGPDAEQAGVELSFPCVWVAPWTRDAGIASLRNTLVLTAFTHDAKLLDELVDEPTISNVYIGDHPTYWLESGIPHDGYLADFLMRTKAVIRD